MKAEKIIDGSPIDPILPKDFDDTPNEGRPASHSEWWNIPFIRTQTLEKLDALYATDTEEARKLWEEGGRDGWLKAWPSGTRYETRCLDGGAWDRSTGWGMFGTLEEAVRCAKEGPAWRRGPSMADELIAERRAEAAKEP